jgi:hypothetical protein
MLRFVRAALDVGRRQATVPRVNTSWRRQLAGLRVLALLSSLASIVLLALAVIDQQPVLQWFGGFVAWGDPAWALVGPFERASGLCLSLTVGGCVLVIRLLLVVPARLAYVFCGGWSLATLGTALLAVAPTAAAMSALRQTPMLPVEWIVALLVVTSSIGLATAWLGATIAPESHTWFDRYPIRLGLPPATHQG